MTTMNAVGQWWPVPGKPRLHLMVEPSTEGAFVFACGLTSHYIATRKTYDPREMPWHEVCKTAQARGRNFTARYPNREA